MKTRKIVLLSLIAFLLCVCVIQGITNSINPVKTLKVEEGFDSIVIEKADSKTTLTLDGKDWYIGNDNFMLNMSDATSMVNNLKEIKILDSVAKLSSEDFNSRYDLTNEKAITVTASKSGKVLRKITIGKVSSTGSQTYITQGDSKEILLIQGNLQNIFNKSEDALKSKFVFGVAKDANISSVSVALKSSSWGVTKEAPVDSEITWSFTGDALSKEADAEKIDSWVSQISSCTAQEWISDDKVLPSNKEVHFEITSSEGNFTIDIYSEKIDDKTVYICTSSKTPHKFILSESNAKKYIKDFNDLVK